MIEMLGVLAIIGVLSAGGIWGYSVAMENLKVNNLAKLIGQTVAGVQNTFRFSNEQFIYSAKQLQQLGIIPSSYETIGDNKFKHKDFGIIYMNGSFWRANSSFTLDTGEVVFIGKRTILFTSLTVSKSVCVKLYRYNWQSLGAFSMIRVKGIYSYPPTTPAIANERCNSVDNVVAIWIAIEGQVTRNYSG